MKRTQHCNELRPAHIGQTVTLAGWVHSRRDLGGLIFIDVRDREGRTQTVFDPSDLAKELFDRAAALRSECVVAITGKVRQRPTGTNNPKIPTGESQARFTPCRNRRSSSNKSSWWPGSNAITNWPAASATRTSARTGSWSSPRLTSR